MTTPPVIRKRTRNLPPPLEPTPHPKLALGFHDRIVIEGIGRVLSADFAELPMRLRRFYRPAQPGRSHKPVMEYRKGEQPTPHSVKLVGREGTLLAGSVIEIARETGPRGHRVHSRFVLNPTRFFRHHGRSLDVSTGNVAPDVLATPRPVSGSGSLDDKDNWLDGEDVGRAAAQWQECLTAYLHAAFSRVSAEISYACQGVISAEAVQFFADRQWIAQAEVYWEFLAPDAQDRAAYFGRSIHAATGTPSSKTLRTTVDYQHNAASYRTQLSTRQPLWFSTYAKTPSRVRFEVQYVGDIAQTVRYGGATDLIVRLERIRRHAHRKAVETLRLVPEDNSEQFSPRTGLTDLLARVSVACGGEPSTIGRTLSALIAARRVIVPDASIPEERLSRLVAQGVLIEQRRVMRTSPPPRYRLAPLYEWVIDRLDQAFPAGRVGRWTGPLTGGGSVDA
jgi:hypothetical protein